MTAPCDTRAALDALKAERDELAQEERRLDYLIADAGAVDVEDLIKQFKCAQAGLEAARQALAEKRVSAAIACSRIRGGQPPGETT